MSHVKMILVHKFRLICMCEALERNRLIFLPSCFPLKSNKTQFDLGIKHN